MNAEVRRYEGIEKVRSEEVTRQVSGSLLPSLSKVRFGGYNLADAGEGVFASVGLFENVEQANESTDIAARWVREWKLSASEHAESLRSTRDRSTSGVARPSGTASRRRVGLWAQETSTKSETDKESFKGGLHESAAAW